MFRKRMGIHISGTGVPDPVGGFDALLPHMAADPRAPSGRTVASDGRVLAPILRNVESSEWKEPTPVQMQALPAMVRGRDVLAAAPTGSGKTAAFLLPMLASLRRRDPTRLRALVLAPTRELTQQIAREGRRLARGTGLRVSALTSAAAVGAHGARIQEEGGEEEEEEEGSSSEGDEDGKGREAEHEETRQGAGAGRSARKPRRLSSMRVPRVDILVTTPLKLGWILQHASGDLAEVQTLVLDEADRLLEETGSFVQQVDAVMAACPRAVQRAFFSATVPPAVEELALSVLRDPVRVTIGVKNAGASLIEQKLLFVGREEGKLLEMRQMAAKGFRPPVLVFVQSKERAKQLSEALQVEGLLAGSMHADMSSEEREAAVRAFRRGDLWILVATDLLGRGIDFKGVRTVINFDFPPSAVSYVHRIGRTGRAGRRGEAVTFFTEDDAPMLRTIANVMRISGCEVPDWMLQLKKLSSKDRRKRARKPLRRKDIYARSRDEAAVNGGQRRKRARPEEIQGKNGGGPKQKRARPLAAPKNPPKP